MVNVDNYSDGVASIHYATIVGKHLLEVYLIAQLFQLERPFLATKYQTK